MRIITDMGKHWGVNRNRFKKYDNDLIYVIMCFIALKVTYSCKHKCFIIHF